MYRTAGHGSLNVSLQTFPTHGCPYICADKRSIQLSGETQSERKPQLGAADISAETEEEQSLFEINDTESLKYACT